MKKKIMALLSFIFISFSMLTGCGGFVEDDSINIASINSQILDDGRTMVVITYTDEEIEPNIFYIPKGDTGEIGETGNGIKSITYKNNESSGTIDLIITFTDSSMEPIELTLTNGVSIKSIEEVKDEDGNNIGFIIHYTDGTSSKQIDIPEGKKGEDGVGISAYRQTVNEDGSSTLTFQFSDGSVYTCEIPAPEKGKDGRGIKTIIGSETETHYVITFFYTDDTDESISFLKPTEPNQWHYGVNFPSVCKDGDFFYNIDTKDIYHRENGSWIPVIDFDDSITTYVVSFDKNADDATYDPNQSYELNVTINKGSCFASDPLKYVIPVPQRQGYRFKGWYTVRNPQEHDYIHGRFTDLTVVVCDLTLYAAWEEI